MEKQKSWSFQCNLQIKLINHRLQELLQKVGEQESPSKFSKAYEEMAIEEYKTFSEDKLVFFFDEVSILSTKGKQVFALSL